MGLCVDHAAVPTCFCITEGLCALRAAADPYSKIGWRGFRVVHEADQHRPGPAAAADGYLGVMLQEVSPSMGKALQMGTSHELGQNFSRAFGIQFLAKDVYYISDLPSELQWADVITISSVSFVLTLVATLYPSWRASRLNPAEALRYE